MAKVVAIIQARMGSTRLPGKVLMPMAGRPMLQHVIERVKEATTIHAIAIATPRSDADAQIGAAGLGPFSFVTIEDENDVLGRFYTAAVFTEADIIVRICGDSPMMRPDLIDDAVERLQSSLAHYVGYVLPDGRQAIDTKRGVYPEVFTARALRWINAAIQPGDYGYDAKREHVTTELRTNPRFHPWLIRVNKDDGIDRAVDTQEDFDRVEQMILQEQAVTV